LGLAFSLDQLPEAAIKYFEEGYQAIKQLRDPAQELHTVILLAKEYSQIHQLDKANKFWEEAAKLSKVQKDIVSEWQSYEEIAKNHFRLRRLDSAIDFHEKAYQLATKSENRRMEALSLQSLALVSTNAGYEADAIKYNEKFFQLAQSMGSLQGQNQALINISKIHTNLNAFKEAKEKADQAMSLAIKSGDKTGEAATQQALALLAQRQGKREEAKQLFQASIETAKQGNNIDIQRTSFDLMADMALEEKVYDQVVKCTHQGMILHEQAADNIARMNSFAKLVEAYRALGKHKEANISHKYGLSLAEQLLQVGQIREVPGILKDI
jgi:tetratricopeptide (TPR) repeat protein